MHDGTHLPIDVGAIRQRWCAETTRVDPDRIAGSPTDAARDIDALLVAIQAAQLEIARAQAAESMAVRQAQGRASGDQPSQRVSPDALSDPLVLVEFIGALGYAPKAATSYGVCISATDLRTDVQMALGSLRRHLE
jgi:hypothetical protein